MQKSDFKRITTHMVETANFIANNERGCSGVNCFHCPFADNNNTNLIYEEDFGYCSYLLEEDVSEAAKRFLYLVGQEESDEEPDLEILDEESHIKFLSNKVLELEKKILELEKEIGIIYSTGAKNE
jgi:hypothetical protein